MFRTLTFISLLALQFGFLSTSHAKRVTTADQMTCQQAVAYYQKHKRIYVLAHGRDVVPVYGMKPINEPLYCGGRQLPVTYFVKTLDVRRCAIAAYCR